MFNWHSNSSNAFWHIYNTAQEVGSLNKKAQTIIGALLGAPQKEPRCSKVFLWKPKRPPNDVGRRLEEDRAEYRCSQHFLPNIAIFEVGRALEVMLGT